MSDEFANMAGHRTHAARQVSFTLDWGGRQVSRARPPQTRANPFGNLPAAQALGQHAETAWSVVDESLVDMGAGLDGVRENLHVYTRDMDDKDDRSAQSSQTRQAQVDAAGLPISVADQCVNSPVQENPACTPGRTSAQSSGDGGASEQAAGDPSTGTDPAGDTTQTSAAAAAGANASTVTDRGSDIGPW